VTPKTIPEEQLAGLILLVRGEKIMLDQDLAELYGVETRVLNQAVRRNIDRFPDDFMFQLSKEEYEILRSQSVTSRWGGRRYPPFAFTEQGVAMLSSVLNSERAIQVNIQIMRMFTRLRQMLLQYEELKQKILDMEAKYDHNFKIVFDVLNRLLEEEAKPKQQIGFQVGKTGEGE